MSKEEFAELLRAKGYHVQIVKGIVTIYGISKRVSRIVDGIAKSVGYHGKFTWEEGDPSGQT